MSENQVLNIAKSRKAEKMRYCLLLAGLAATLIAAFLIALCSGRYSVSVSEVFKIGMKYILRMNVEVSEKAESVVCVLRMPRIIGAILVGGALALSGAAYQGVFKNPLVAPDLLGVSSGACVGASAAIILGFGSLGIQLSAFVMGIATVALTLTIPRMLKNSSMMMLVLSGVIVKGVMDSVLGIIKYIADAETQLASITYWQMGSLTKVVYKDLLAIGPVIVIAAAMIILLRWRINILSLGDKEAKSLGINIGLTRGIIIFCATLLTACAVCICGTIGWVGLVIPHLARMAGGQDNRRSIPVSVFMGAIFMLLIDTLARNLTTMELPLSILTGLVGAPFYFIILAKQRMRMS